MEGFTLAAAQIGQFMKPNEMSETSISYGGLSSAGSAPCPGAVVRVVADHDGVVPGCPSKDTTVTDVVLDVADGERGATTVVVFRVELVRKCNRLGCGGSPCGNSFLY